MEVPFKEIPVGSEFEFEGHIWHKYDTDQNGWNAVCGHRWGQFEDDEMCKPVKHVQADVSTSS